MEETEWNERERVRGGKEMFGASENVISLQT